MNTLKKLKRDLEKEIKGFEKEFKQTKEEGNLKGIGDLELFEADITFTDYIPLFHRIRLSQMFIECKLEGVKIAEKIFVEEQLSEGEGK